MKILLIALSLAVSALIAQAQTVTNIAWRITVETGTVGVSSNAVVSNLRWDYGTPKDLTRINGLVFAWNGYKTGGGTNALGDWIKTDVKDRADAYASVKQQADYSALLAKLQYALFTDPSLLDPTNFTALNVIAAKVP